MFSNLTNIDVINKFNNPLFNIEVANNNLHLSCENLVSKALEKISDCSYTNIIWENLNKNSAYQVLCKSREFAPTGAIAHIDKREIWIADHEKLHKNSVDMVISSILFEIFNSQQAEQITQINNNRCSFDQEEYLKKVKAIEFQSLQSHYIATSHCMKEKGWSTKTNEFYNHFENNPTYENDWRNFESYSNAMEKSGHSNFVRLMWNAKCKMIRQ
jgi:hypothetical protein